MSNQQKIVKVGIVGAGNISSTYLENGRWLEGIEVVAIADILPEAAAAQAAKFDIPQVLTVDEIMANDEIELILNLTIPSSHAEVALAAVSAGKSVYNEKPLTLSREEGQTLLTEAEKQNVQVGCAPDTFLGASHQTARQLIDEGIIGQPVAVNAFMMSWGMEMWHPNPGFFFKAGGGPMFDMGPYYLTDLIFLLGHVAQVSGMATIGRPQRTITSQPLNGTLIDVEIPTHVAGLLHFANGAIGTMITSFDVAGTQLPKIEIHGTKGSLSVPDPNRFGGDLLLKLPGQEWEAVPLSHAYQTNCRGLGLADMASALRYGRPHRANGRLAYHVLDLMHAFHESADSGRHIKIESRCERPQPLPTGWEYGQPPEEL